MRLLYLLPIAAILWLIQPEAMASDVAYSTSKWNGISVHVVTVNLNSQSVKVTPALSKHGAGSSETFASMLNRTKPAAAITGTFFCTRSLRPTGDIVIEGRSIYSGCVGAGICITSSNKVEFVPIEIGRRTKWSGYDSVVCAGPTLVRKGVIRLTPRDEGFRDPGIYQKKQRTALGVTSGNKLLLVAVKSPVNLKSLAKIMQYLGAVNAVDLDGGSSTALYCHGKTISRPGRKLTNLLVAYETAADYQNRRLALAPEMRVTTVVAAGTVPANRTIASASVYDVSRIESVTVEPILIARSRTSEPPDARMCIAEASNEIDKPVHKEWF